MAVGWYHRQAREYTNSRPQYPPELFSFIAKHTPIRRLAWDAGTGNGQAAVAVTYYFLCAIYSFDWYYISLLMFLNLMLTVEIYDRVIATDVSEQQISYAPRRPNITYAVTPRAMSLEELESTVGAEGSVDLVTAAQALHWFDIDAFYSHVKHVLRKPGGVFAAWCYREPVVNPTVDSVFHEVFRASGPFWDRARQLVDEEYTTLYFPFGSVVEEGSEGHATAVPIKFWAKKEMGLEGYMTYMRSWPAYHTAKDSGIDLLDDQTVARLKEAWGESDDDVKTASFPVFLRIGVV